MTPEEIDAMPAGPEMDALVATEIMGWEAYIRNGRCYSDRGTGNAPDCWGLFEPSQLIGG